ncbi:Rab3 GTPase-activating protein regulatory subunit N-terminus-domain-containing protein [Pilobolus umbonatus]|nr:Rab3 GTPase-activating protein regulatory subunit N-terminus-domain-containing protein [Pilobolus umbonatus]
MYILQDGWDKDWSWGVDEVDPLVASVRGADIITRSASPNISSKDNYLISASSDGSSLVLAYKTKFLMVQLNSDEEYSALGQGSGCQLPKQNFIMCGYNTGWIRVFSDVGTPPPTFKVSPLMFMDEDEDITILFEGNKVVTIDGQSLWLALRVCDGQRESGIDSSRMHTAFIYKKWDLNHQDQVLDINPYTISTTTFPVKDATARYIGVGSQPMLTYYVTSESSRPLMSATSMASYVVSRVASPVFSFAKSWWGSAGHNNQKGSFNSSSPTPYVPDMPRPPSHIEPATPIPSVFSANDAYRRITQISISPPSTSSQRHTLAATSDVLGRVILWDVIEGEMIRMWKGVRDAVCGWIEVFEDDLYERNLEEPTVYNNDQKILQFLVIYSSRRGLLKVFQMRYGKQVGVFHVGAGWQLVPCGREPLGSSMASFECRKQSPGKGGSNDLSNCLLVGPDGEVRKIKIILKRPTEVFTSTEMIDQH